MGTGMDYRDGLQGGGLLTSPRKKALSSTKVEINYEGFD
jgi:hypothetical protein